MISILIIFSLIFLVFAVKEIGGDQHYGNVGFGGMTMSAADTFSTAQLATLMQPTVFVKKVDTKDLLKIQIEDIIVWDVRKYNALQSTTPDVTGGEDLVHTVEGGITIDNTRDSTDRPTAESAAQGTRPGGQVANITGDAGTATVPPQMTGAQPIKYETYFDWHQMAVEEQTAVGQILQEPHQFPRNPEQSTYTPYEVEGLTLHHLLTGAHYHFWATTIRIQSPGQFSIGADAKKMSVDFDEVQFDRASMFNLIEALEAI